MLSSSNRFSLLHVASSKRVATRYRKKQALEHGEVSREWVADEDSYGATLSTSVWDAEEEEWEFGDDRYFHISDEGEWKPSDPHKMGEAEGDWVLDDVMDEWEKKKAPRITMEKVTDHLYALGLRVSGVSNRSEAVYMSKYRRPDDDDPRIRVATHEPVYQSSIDAFNILIGIGPNNKQYGKTYYLPNMADASEIRKACKTALKWIEQKELEQKELEQDE